LPWSMRNYKTYGTFTLSPSGAYNFAAVAIAPARGLVEGRDRLDILREWETIASQSDQGNPFKKSAILAGLARTWALSHPIALVGAVLRGQAALLLGPSRAVWEELGISAPSPGAPSIPIALLVVWRAAVVLTAGIGVYQSFRKRQLIYPGLAVLIYICLLAFPSGAGGYGRFSVPIIPALALLAGLACRSKPGQSTST